MTSLLETVERIDRRVSSLEGHDEPVPKPPKKKRSFRFPKRTGRKTKGKTDKVVCLWLGRNRQAQFKVAKISDGLLIVGEQQYDLDASYIYLHKKWHIVVVFEWRILPVGGLAEEYRTRIIGGQKDEDVAKDLNLGTRAQMTIIRGLEKAEMEKTDGKKKFGGSPVIWIIIGVIIVGFIVSQMFTGG